MNTRLAQGIAAVAVFGAMFFGTAGGHGSTEAASTGFLPQGALGTTAQHGTLSAGATQSQHTLPQFLVSASMPDLDQNSDGTISMVIPGVPTGHLPLTKGGRFP